MKLKFLRSLDFNQMLVTSVFVHLLFVTVVLFLPKVQIEEDIVVQALMVQLVDIPAGQKVAEEKPKPKQVALKSEAEKAPSVTKAVENKPVATKPPPSELEFTPMEIPKPEAIIKPVDTGKSNEMLKELDQLAKLSPKRTPKKQNKKSKVVLEETFLEQDAIKQRKLTPKVKDLVPPVVVNPMKQFEELQLEELEDQPDVHKPVESLKEKDLFEELEFVSLDRNVIPEEKNKKSAADLLKELSKLSDLEMETPPKLDLVPPEKLFELEKTKDPKTFAPILDKLASLDVAPMEISIDVDTNRAIAKDFESGVWKVKVPDVVNPGKDESPSYVFSDLEGPPGADALSLYIGAIREKVYRKWHEPLAEKHNKEVLVSFYLFPKGKIDKPILKRSSGVEQLDSLAIRAILDSEPFPSFPQELKFSNLNITINFKYVPEK